MSTVLAIDTASTGFAVAVAIDGQVTGAVVHVEPQAHSTSLLGAIDRLLGGSRERLAGLVAVQGPGSYAGLRAGIATAHGLGLALGVPVRGVPTLRAVALASGLSEVTAIHPAGRGEFAAQLFRDAAPAGPLRTETAETLTGLSLAGEGAGALGGTEIGPAERCRAALEASADAFGPGAGAAGIEALYLREPSITVSRRPRPALRPR